MSQLEVRGIGKSFAGKQVLRDVTLDLADGEFLCLLGPTNAGKTTLLKIISGLLAADTGSVSIGARDVTRLDPAARKVSHLFQTIALFPDRTGFENIAFPLRHARVGESEIRRRAREVAELLRVTHLLDRLPATFSGGERQRVAIGRAIARPAEILLLDEPLSNLDARIRLDLRREFKRLHRRLGQTFLYVTHDQSEALALADRVAVLNQGRLEQVATPQEIYDSPATSFLAGFVGAPPFNLLPVEIASGDHGSAQIRGAGLKAQFKPTQQPDAGSYLLGVRAEQLRVSTVRTEETPMRADLRWIEEHGARRLLHFTLGAGQGIAVAPASLAIQPESGIWLGLPSSPLPLFRASGGPSSDHSALGKWELINVQAL